MPKKKDELKAKLLAEAEASIEQLVLDERMSSQMTMTEIEDVIGEMEKGCRDRVLQEVMDEQTEQVVRIVAGNCETRVSKANRSSSALCI